MATTEATAPAPGQALTRERNLILVSLLALAAAAWALMFWQGMADDGEMSMGLTVGMSAPLFIAMWFAMMVAMMFPTAAPMVLMFAKLHSSRKERGQPYVPTSVFVSSYMIVWTAAGVLAYGLAVGAEGLAEQWAWLSEHAARIGGGVLLLAGLYQLSPLKRSCMTKCQTPFQFIMTSWREGHVGALRMGMEHGVYCLGCCAFLFVILFPLGVMNIGAMVGITVLIFAEKSAVVGRQAAMAAAAALVAYGIAVVFVPELLPTWMGSMESGGGMEMGG